MLIQCPECELQVSDKASFCPHCGYPFVPAAKISARRANKRKRLPNGFGQISEIKGRSLRKPFRAMVTIGKNEKGKPIVKPLKPESYFKTYNDAYSALIAYHKNPYDFVDGITMNELFNRWIEKHGKTVSPKNEERIRRMWRFCGSIYQMNTMDLRPRHIKYCLDHGTANIGGVERTPTAADKGVLKSLFNLMLDYALEYEMVEQNYARNFSLDDETVKEITDVKQPHVAFTDEEMTKLWAAVPNIWFVKNILIQCYSGWRPQEICKLRVANIDFEKGIMKGGMKTESGTGRVVPIHPKISAMLKEQYDRAVDKGFTYLLEDYSYKRYLSSFYEVVGALSLDPVHRPHDGRKQFVTMAKRSKMDEYAIKRIVGHKITDITETVYTERDENWLKEEMQKIT